MISLSYQKKNYQDRDLANALNRTRWKSRPLCPCATIIHVHVVKHSILLIAILINIFEMHLVRASENPSFKGQVHS